MKTFSHAAPLDLFHGLLSIGVAEEQGNDVAAHVILVRVDVLHTPFVGQLDALVNDLLRQMRDGEEVDVLIVVRRPQLRLFGQDVLGASSLTRSQKDARGEKKEGKGAKRRNMNK